MSDNIIPVDVSMPDTMLVMYADFAMIYKDQYGAIIDFAHSMGPVKRKNVIARIGMSHAMLKELHHLLTEQLKQLDQLKKG